MRCLLFVGLLIFMAPARAIDFSEVAVNGKRVTICRVDVAKERLQLFLKDSAGKTFKSFDAIQRTHKLLFAMNAGMYHRDFSPVGLFISDGREISSLNTSSAFGNFFLKPNGVFVLTDSGVHVIETSEYPALKSREKVILATQSGPLLVRNGKIHPKFDSNGTSRLIRNGVGVPSPGVAVFAIAEDPVNFYEFATLFRDMLHCPDALFFDGTVSSLFSTKLRRNDRKINLGPIIGIAEADSSGQDDRP